VLTVHAVTSPFPAPMGTITGTQTVSGLGYGIWSGNLTSVSTSSVEFVFASQTNALILFTPQPVNGGGAGSWPLPSTYYAYYFPGHTNAAFNVNLSQYYFILFAVGSPSSVTIYVDGVKLQVADTQQFNNCAIDPTACPAVRNLLLSDGLGINTMTCSSMGTTAAGNYSVQLTGPAPTCESIGGTQIDNLQANVVSPSTATTTVTTTTTATLTSTVLSTTTLTTTTTANTTSTVSGLSTLEALLGVIAVIAAVIAAAVLAIAVSVSKKTKV